MADTGPSEGWRRLSAAARVEAPHAVETWALGEYAALLQRRGEEIARRQLPEVAAHLETGCPLCARELAELVAFAERDEELSRAFARYGESQRYLDSLDEPMGHAAELRRYRQRRWDSGILRDVAELDEELRRRLWEVDLA